jgi:hypothetical protein
MLANSKWERGSLAPNATNGRRGGMSGCFPPGATVIEVFVGSPVPPDREFT